MSPAPPDARVRAHGETFPTLAFMGGFECSSHRRRDGLRVDALAASGHARHAEADYRLAKAHGLSTVRDGLRWHLIERAEGQYDWASWRPMIEAAQSAGVEVIWDIWHYGAPDTVDIWSPEFVTRLAGFARAAARLHLEITDAPALWCPLNEMSFFSYIAGEVGDFHPYAQGRGYDLKRQLARAAIAVANALLEVDPRARLVWAEPLIHVRPRSSAAHDVERARGFHEAQYQALDMIAGRLERDLGGDPQLLGIVGCNFYPQNQWVMDGAPIPLGHYMHRPLGDMLVEVHDRYRRPMIIAETGAEGAGRAPWLHYVAQEARDALARGVDLQGVCLYPVTDYVGWDDERPCPTGLFGEANPEGRRELHQPLADELSRQQGLMQEWKRSIAQRT